MLKINRHHITHFAFWLLLFSTQLNILCAQQVAESVNPKFQHLFFKALKEKSVGNLGPAITAFKQCLEIDEEADAVWYELARLQAADGDITSSINSIDRAIALNDTNSFYLSLAAELYRSKEEVKKALALYDKIIELKPNDPDVYLSKAQLYEELGDLGKTEKLYAKVIELTGESLDINYRKIQGYVRAGKMDKAINLTQELIEENPAIPELREMQVDFYLMRNRGDEAIAELNRILEIDPKYGKAHIKLAFIQVNKGDFKAAITHAEEAFSNAEIDIDDKMRLLLIFYESSNMDKTHVDKYIKLAKEMVIAHPQDGKSHAVLGDLLLRENQLEAAWESYKKAIKVSPDKRLIWERILEIETSLAWVDLLIEDSKTAISYFPSQPIFYLYKGLGEIQKGEHEESTFTLETGLALVVKNPAMELQFYNLLGDAFNAMEKHQKSDRYYEKGLQIDPENPLLLNNYAYSLTVRGKNLQEAKNMLEQALKSNGQAASFLDSYAWVLYKLEDYDKARLYIQRAIEAGGNEDGAILEHYGDILFKLDEPEEALKFWLKASGKEGVTDKLQEKIDRKELVD